MLVVVREEDVSSLEETWSPSRQLGEGRCLCDIGQKE